MASFYPCVKNHASGYTFYISLVSQANTKIMQASPTLAAGDFKIAIDDGAPANLGTLPVVDADYTKRVKVVLSQAETNGDNLTIICSDAAGAEWCDLTVNIQTVPYRFDNLDAAISSRMATYTQPTGFLAATFPATVASTTNITAGTITTVGTVNALAGDSVTAAALAADAGTEIGNAVWAITSALSGKTYGLLLAELNAAQIIRVGQCQAGSTTQAIVLDASASATDDFYNRTTITFATGPAAGQNRLINDYDGATKTAYLNRPLLVGAPALNNWFAIDSRGNMRSASDLRIGLAQAGGASSITLATAESALNDFYNRMFILIESGTGEGQARLIDDYDGASRVATVARPWVVQPDGTSRYVILPSGSVKVSDIDADAVNASALAADAVAEIAAAILATPANLLATDGTGQVAVGTVAANAIGDAQLAADVDTYQAKVWVFDDDAGANDRYACVWHKNGQPVTSGITSPTIQVIKGSDGTDLVAVAAMTQIGATGLYKHDEAAGRMVSGAAYIVKVQATIDGSTRTWYQPVGRDSSV